MIPRDYITARSFCFFSLSAADLKVFMTGNASNLSFSGSARRAFGKSEVDNGCCPGNGGEFLWIDSSRRAQIEHPPPE